MANGLVLVSATPIQMRSTDLFNLLHLLDADAFPYEWTYDQSVQANAPIVALRDRVLRERVRQDEFVAALQQGLAQRFLDDSEQIRFLLAEPPSNEDLASPTGRARSADQLDRINPRAKVIVRTLERDVDELRVEREPVTIKARMSATEREFYDRVTDAVRDYCEAKDVGEGFLLTIPQRQMSSCMAAACRGWATRREAEPDELEETLYELDGEPDLAVADNAEHVSSGGIMINPSTAPYAAPLLRVSLGVLFLAHVGLKIFVFSFPVLSAIWAPLACPPSSPTSSSPWNRWVASR